MALVDDDVREPGKGLWPVADEACHVAGGGVPNARLRPLRAHSLHAQPHERPVSHLDGTLVQRVGCQAPGLRHHDAHVVAAARRAEKHDRNARRLSAAGLATNHTHAVRRHASDDLRLELLYWQRL